MTEVETPPAAATPQKTGLANFKIPAEQAKAAVPDKKEPEIPLEPPKKGEPIEKEQPPAAEKKKPALEKAPVKEVAIPDEVEITPQEQEFYDSLGLEEQKPETKPTEKKGKKEPVDAEMQQLRKAKQEYEALLKDPLQKVLYEFKKSGKSSLEEFITTAIPSDPSKLSADQLHELDINDPANGYTDEEKKEAREEFAEQTDYKKKQITKPIRERLMSQRSEQMKKLSVSAPVDKVAQQKIIDDGFATLDTTLSNMRGKIKHGLLIDEDVATLIREDVIENAVMKEDGSAFDIERSVENAFRNNDRVFEKIVKSNVAFGKKLGYSLAIKQRTRPDPQHLSTGSIPDQPEDKRSALNAVKKDKWRE